jgi:hypothetical protein
MTGGYPLIQEAIGTWEGEGGGLRQTAQEAIVPEFEFVRALAFAAPKKMIGTANQVDWAEWIKRQVNGEFGRVSKALKSAACQQAEQKRMETLSLIAILEEKWAEVMAKDHAGYFIHEWQELRDQVRQMIIQDSRYQAIRANRAAR